MASLDVGVAIAQLPYHIARAGDAFRAALIAAVRSHTHTHDDHRVVTPVTMSVDPGTTVVDHTSRLPVAHHHTAAVRGCQPLPPHLELATRFDVQLHAAHVA